MENINFKELFNHASFVRTSIEQCKLENRHILNSFPYGYCAKASVWLYDYLNSKGYLNIEFHMRDPFLEDFPGNHVWLNISGYAIDITADQYNMHGYDFSSIIVTNKNNLYAKYEEENILSRDQMFNNEYIGNLIVYHHQTYDEWMAIYQKLGINY